MLRAGGNAVCLNSSDVRRRHLAGEIGILGEIFEVTSAKRRALNVESRAEHDVYVVCRRFFAESASKLLGKLGIPGVCHTCRGREAGCGNRFVQSEMIGRARLLAKTVRAVGEKYLGYIRVLE